MKQVELAWVTGAGGALGGTLARALEGRGVQVKALTRGLLNLADPDAVRAFVRGEASRDGVPDALFHCAGGFRYTKIEACADADFQSLLDANLRSTFHLLRELGPAMKAKGFGRMVFVGARAAADRAGAGMGPYAASKAGLHALVSAAAAEFEGSGVLVSAVLPTILDTPANRKDMPGADHSKWVGLPMLSEFLADLALRDAELFHGALLPVPGRL